LGYAAEVKLVGDADGEEAAKAEGYEAITIPPLPVVEFPKWQYHADGRQMLVHSQAEQDALGEGFDDLPQDPADADEATAPKGRRRTKAEERA
jgi:hypothetical protein